MRILILILILLYSVTFASPLFLDEDSTGILLLSTKKNWVTMAQRLPLYNLSYIDLSVGAMLRYEQKAFQSETQDLRVAFGLKHEWGETYLSHLSGHAFEDIPNPELIPLNVGDDGIGHRYTTKIFNHFFLGFNAQYLIETASEFKKFQIGEFIKYSYYSLGLSHYGKNHYTTSVHLLFDFPIFENWSLHLGFYNGLDPREKYSHGPANRSSFYYLGIRTSSSSKFPLSAP